MYLCFYAEDQFLEGAETFFTIASISALNPMEPDAWITGTYAMSKAAEARREDSIILEILQQLITLVELFPSSTGIKNSWSCSSTSTYAFMP
jgi:hypothetical protein